MTNDLLTGVEAAAGLAVYGADAVDSTAAASVRQALLAGDTPGRLAAKDPTLWGPSAESGAGARLGWLDAYRRSRELLPQLAELRAELADLDRVVLCGTGGATLAAQAITRTLGVALTVLDTSDPHQIATVLYAHHSDPGARAERLRRTVVVLTGAAASIQTDAHRRVFQQAFAEHGFTAAEAGRHFVVVTPAGSALAETAHELGAVVVPADPAVGESYAALTAFGLAPAALAGVDVARLLDEAELFAPSLSGDVDNPGLALGAALAAAATAGRDTVALVADGTGLVGIGDWAAELLAASTGKDGLGLLPVVVEAPDSPGAVGADVLTVSYGGALAPAAVPGGGVLPDLAVNGPLGAQFLAWEYATAVVGQVLGVDPFDQPDDTEGDRRTAALLADAAAPPAPTFVDGAIQVHTHSGAGDLPGVLRDLVAGIGGGHLTVTAYLDHYGDGEIVALRAMLAAAAGRPVTFGWGPATSAAGGPVHTDGPQVGSYLQITGGVTEDLAVPGRSFTFGRLQAAQAERDRQAVVARHRPLLWLHLTDRAAGVRQLLAAAAALPV